MGEIGREIIRRTQERIIAMGREIDWMRSQGGYADRIAQYDKDIREERESLKWKISVEK